MVRGIYRFVDFTTRGNTFHKWRRIEVKDIPQQVSRFYNQDVFSTIQTYHLTTRTVNEDHYCGIFFDFDSEDLDVARKDTIAVLDFFSALKVPSNAISVFFSGRRGFHFVVEPEVFGIVPSNDLTSMVKVCCDTIAQTCSLSTYDGSVYSSARMWRVENSLNTKSESRSYKIRLTLEEVRNLSSDEIRKLASSPRSLPEINISELLPELEWWWKQWVEERRSRNALQSLRPKIAPKFDDVPDCVKDVLSSGLKIPGSRNRATIVLATFCKARGLDKEQATALLEKWVGNLDEGMTGSTQRDRVANAKAVVDTVYRDEKSEKYAFACSYMRSLGNSENPVSCSREKCKYSSVGESVTPREVNLENSTLACYEGVPILTEGLCAGKDYSPHLIPSLIVFECDPPKTSRKDSPCAICGLHQSHNRLELRIKPSDPAILGMIDVSSDIVKNILYTRARVRKSCRAFRMKVVEYQNVRHVMLVPEIRFNPTTIVAERTYALVEAYFVGHDVTTNDAYKVTAYLLAHPKAQYAVLLASEMKQKALAWQEQLPDDVYEKLKVFQTTGNPLDKMAEIWEDFESNVTHLVGRRLLGMAVDLVYHSALSFFFDGPTDFVLRGWAELLVYGDTDTGKTHMAKMISAHYQLGTLVSCETTTRTGLTYSIQESGNRWIVIAGMLPLNDRGLVWLDEFRSLPNEDRKEMTQMRVDGLIRISRVRQAILPARVRLIFMSGPKRAMSEYDYGIEAITEIFEEREDIRRLDMVVIMGTQDVPVGVFRSRRFDSKEHIYTTELCNMLIRWVWSLRPEQIKFTEDAIGEVFNQVTYLTNRFTETVPVLKIEDLRYKIARIAIAIAARTFNSLDGGKTLLVETRHIESASFMLNTMYSTPVCGLAEKSSSERRRRDLENVNKDEARDALKALLGRELHTFCDIMLENKVFGRGDIQDMMGWSSDRTREIFGELVGLRLFKRLPRYKGFVKTQPLIDILRTLERDIKVEEAIVESEQAPEPPVNHNEEMTLDDMMNDSGDSLPE